MELRALAHFAFDPDPAAVCFYQVFGDGQPQACATDFAGARDVHTVKALEDAGLVGFRNADTGVGDGEGDFRVVSRSADHDLATGLRVLHGVVEQILEDFGEAAAVGGDIGKRLLQIHG